MGEFRMPSLGAEMDAGRVVEWLVEPGHEVHHGDIVAIVETDKAELEVEVFEDGVVSELLVPEGAKVPVGTVLARIDDGSGAVESAVSTAGKEQPAPAVVAVAAPPAPAEVPGPRAVQAAPARMASPIVRKLARDLEVDLAGIRGTGPGDTVTRADVTRAALRVRASPYARRLAADRGVDLAGVQGSGPGAAVLGRDVLAAPAGRKPAEPGRPREPAAEPPVTEPSRPEAMRLAIGRAMARSKREIPHYYLGASVDVSRALTWLRDRNDARPITERLIPAALFLKATAHAGAAHPNLNGFWVDDRFEPAERVHVGVAIAMREGGLIAPAIHDVDELTLDDLMAALRDLVSRVRAGRLRTSEMTDATITVSNLGDQGVETVYGVIYPPQVALVGFGAVVERPVAVDGLLGARETVTATLSGDHRASDGHAGARFLSMIGRLLQEPEKL